MEKQQRAEHAPPGRPGGGEGGEGGQLIPARRPARAAVLVSCTVLALVALGAVRDAGGARPRSRRGGSALLSASFSGGGLPSGSSNWDRFLAAGGMVAPAVMPPVAGSAEPVAKLPARWEAGAPHWGGKVPTPAPLAVAYDPTQVVPGFTSSQLWPSAQQLQRAIFAGGGTGDVLAAATPVAPAGAAPQPVGAEFNEGLPGALVRGASRVAAGKATPDRTPWTALHTVEVLPESVQQSVPPVIATPSDLHVRGSVMPTVDAEPAAPTFNCLGGGGRAEAAYCRALGGQQRLQAQLQGLSVQFRPQHGGRGGAGTANSVASGAGRGAATQQEDEVYSGGVGAGGTPQAVADGGYNKRVSEWRQLSRGQPLGLALEREGSPALQVQPRTVADDAAQPLTYAEMQANALGAVYDTAPGLTPTLLPQAPALLPAAGISVPVAAPLVAYAAPPAAYTGPYLYRYPGVRQPRLQPPPVPIARAVKVSAPRLQPPVVVIRTTKEVPGKLPRKFDKEVEAAEAKIDAEKEDQEDEYTVRRSHEPSPRATFLRVCVSACLLVCMHVCVGACMLTVWRARAPSPKVLCAHSVMCPLL